MAECVSAFAKESTRFSWPGRRECSEGYRRARDKQDRVLQAGAGCARCKATDFVGGTEQGGGAWAKWVGGG